MRIIRIQETDSTNDYVRQHMAEFGHDTVMVVAERQLAGRGCGDNKWETEPGKNLTFSVLSHPQGVAANRQFVLSIAEALAVRDALAAYVTDIRLKWPNDIYWRDCKLGGTLIEASLQGGMVSHCVFGTGLNVNQRKFLSDAPNPVSLCAVLGHEVDREPLLEAIAGHLERRLTLVDEGQWSRLWQDYRGSLYRRGEEHDYRFSDGRVVRCLLSDVADDGRLILKEQREWGSVEVRCGFKEVQFII